MDPELATLLQAISLALIAAVGLIISAVILSRVTIYAIDHDDVRPVEPHENKDDGATEQVAERRNESSKLTVLLRVSPGFVGPVIFCLALVAVFVYIPFVSNYAFWFMAAAYIIMASGYRLPART